MTQPASCRPWARMSPASSRATRSLPASLIKALDHSPSLQ
jgi:hypothetical protein